MCGRAACRGWGREDGRPPGTRWKLGIWTSPSALHVTRPWRPGDTLPRGSGLFHLPRGRWLGSGPTGPAGHERLPQEANPKPRWWTDVCVTGLDFGARAGLCQPSFSNPLACPLHQVMGTAKDWPGDADGGMDLPTRQHSACPEGPTPLGRGEAGPGQPRVALCGTVWPGTHEAGDVGSGQGRRAPERSLHLILRAAGPLGEQAGHVPEGAERGQRSHQGWTPWRPAL